MSDLKDGQSPLDIINDPKNFVSANEAYKLDEEKEGTSCKETKKSCGISRRNMLKLGAATAAASVVASGITGFRTGRHADGYTGYGKTFYGEDMFFNREPFRTDVAPMFTPVGEVTRPDWHDHLLYRFFPIVGMINSKVWNPTMGVEKMPAQYGEFYRANPAAYENLLERIDLLYRRLADWNTTTHKQFRLATAYTNAYNTAQKNQNGATIPESPDDYARKVGRPVPPEEWDFRHIRKDREKLVFKSPAHATKLIKRMAHVFGASVVGICKFDERFMFKNQMRGMPKGGLEWGDKVPEHWKSMIVVGQPMHWESTYAAIGYSTSQDGYFRTSVICGLLEIFIQNLGYPARAHCPNSGYEIMMSPYTILCGLAEYSRAGLVMVPELGSNFRPGGVVTNIEFEYDRPINVGMAEFCKKCKICADTCPSGAITHDDEPTVVTRGFKRWLLDEEKCHRMWVAGSTEGGDGCRVCIAVCPYTRKNTWIHKISRDIEPRDPTGLFATGLLAMQTNFFKYPAGEEFRGTWDGGRDANYHDAPIWERTEEFFTNVDQTWDYQGMH